MKKLFVFITLSIFNLTQIFGQSGWRADLRVYNESYIQETEVNVNMVVDLYYDDVLVLPQSNYKYEFFTDMFQQNGLSLFPGCHGRTVTVSILLF